MLQTHSVPTATPVPPPPYPRDRLIRLAQVMETIGLGRTRVYEMIKDGTFPAPCKPGGTASRWSENEVLAWLAECASQRVH